MGAPQHLVYLAAAALLLLLQRAPTCGARAGGAVAGTRYDIDAGAGDAGGANDVVVLAAGCYWSVELVFQRTHGVVGTKVGFVGGTKEAPTYRDVTTGRTGHAEAVEVTFDPAVVSFTKLLDLFFAIHDPTTLNQQGNDRGTQYRSGIFYTHNEQREAAEQYIAQVKGGVAPKEIVTEVSPATVFWSAEEAHQRYLEKLGQDATKGSLEPIQCYGDYGPVKQLDKPFISKIIRGTGQADTAHQEL